MTSGIPSKELRKSTRTDLVGFLSPSTCLCILCLGHVPHGRDHLPTTIVWNSPMQELIGSVMVSSLLLPAFGILPSSVFLASFNLPSFKR